MKKIFSTKATYLACSILMAILLFSCAKEDEYKKYVNGEERIYRAKPMDLTIQSGYMRAMVYFKLYNPLKIKSYEVYFDDKKVAEGPVAYADTVRILNYINTTEEKTYQVSAVTVDENGLRSVKTTGFVNILGNRYISGLNSRGIAKKDYTEPGIVNFTFSAPEESLIESKMEYTNFNGVKKTLLIPNTTNNLTLNDLPLTGNILYTTYILPDFATLDTLTTIADTIKMQELPKQWFSSQETSGEGADNGRVAQAFDGDLTTFWHTRWVGGELPYPHWFIQDLGASTTINSFQIARRNNPIASLSTKIRIEVKDIGTNWKLVGEYTPNININGYQLFMAQNIVSGRFMRYTGLEGTQTYTTLAEFKINPN